MVVKVMVKVRLSEWDNCPDKDRGYGFLYLLSLRGFWKKWA